MSHSDGPIAHSSIPHADVAVIGLGFAGAAVALEAVRLGLTVRVFQHPVEPYPKASRVASGLINPLVLKRRRMVGGASVAWPLAREFYQRLEEETGASFFARVPVREHLATVKDAADWSVLAERPGFAELLEPDSAANPFEGLELNRLGTVRASGRIVPGRYFEAVDVRLAGQVSNETVFDLWHKQGRWHLLGNDQEVRATASRVVLCEGPRAPLSERFWGDLGFALVRGEGIDVEIPELNLDGPLHGKFFLLPAGEGHSIRYKVGATYAWDGLEQPVPTAEGRQELEDWLHSWLRLPYAVVDHWCGVRPARKSREILCEWHTDAPGLGILNGLGSRGALMAPWKARQLFSDESAVSSFDAR
jgi:glycine/D-amino acid oxidase-like deaminating enzyme